MNEYGWTTDQHIAHRAAAEALLGQPLFHSLLEELSSALTARLERDSLDATLRGESHQALCLAAQAQGINDFLSCLQRLDPTYAPAKTSYGER